MAMQPETLDVTPEPKFVGVQYAATTTGLSRGSIYAPGRQRHDPVGSVR